MHGAQTRSRFCSDELQEVTDHLDRDCDDLRKPQKGQKL